MTIGFVFRVVKRMKLVAVYQGADKRETKVIALHNFTENNLSTRREAKLTS